MIAVKGSYKITQDDKLIIEGENLITLLGESFFMNRWVNDEFTPITSILLGKGTGRPLRSNTSLGEQTFSKNATATVDVKNKQVILECDCTSLEILDVTEIGVSNGDVLISRDLFKAIDGNMIAADLTSLVHIEYVFNLSTGGVRSEWKQSTNGNDIYYIYEPNSVIGVIESNTNSGYTRKNSVEELEEEKGSYYYNSSSNNLYIRNTKGTDPNNDEIIVQTK